MHADKDTATYKFTRNFIFLMYCSFVSTPKKPVSSHFYFPAAMTKFIRLPIDIIQIIIHCIVDCAGPTITSAGVTVPLLAVCREWRSIVVPMFYNWAGIRGYICSDFSLQPTRTYFQAQTNIDLILKNGYGDKVKNFAYFSQENEYSVDSLMHMAQMLNIGADNCPELATLMDYHGSNSNIPMDWNNKSLISAITTIATALASKFPNTRQLDISISNAHDVIIYFSTALTDCFADKLVVFEYTGTLRFPNKQLMPRLEMLCLNFTGDDEEQMYTTICPRSIQKLNLFINGFSFNWNIFSIKGDSADIVFDQLENLSCKSYNFDEHISGPNIDHRLLFPKIMKTAAHNFKFSVDNMERQLNSGLCDLQYFATLSDLVELSRLDLSGLTNLKLEFCGPDNTDVEEDFVALTNTLFRRLKGIPSVPCTIHRGILTFIPANFFWPNLTHLVIDKSVICGNIFEAVHKMPDLICLETSHCTFNAILIDTALTYFKNLRNNFVEPSNSNITTLRIRGIKQIYYDQLLSSIQVLRWYWPKLTTIDISFVNYV